MKIGSEDEEKGAVEVEGRKRSEAQFSGLRLFLAGIVMSENETMKLSPESRWFRGD